MTTMHLVTALAVLCGLVLAAEGADADRAILVDKAAFLGDLRADRPALGPARAAAARGDVDQAAALYGAYFRHKALTPSRLFTDWASMKRNPAYRPRIIRFRSTGGTQRITAPGSAFSMASRKPSKASCGVAPPPGPDSIAVTRHLLHENFR